jgi:hypothetical protein
MVAATKQHDYSTKSATPSKTTKSAVAKNASAKDIAKKVSGKKSTDKRGPTTKGASLTTQGGENSDPKLYDADFGSDTVNKVPGHHETRPAYHGDEDLENRDAGADDDSEDEEPEADEEPQGPSGPDADEDPEDSDDSEDDARPSKSAKSSKPTKPSKPSKPTKPSKSTKPTKSVKSAKSAKPTKHDKSVNPTKPTKPTKSTKSTKSTKPTKSAKRHTKNKHGDAKTTGKRSRKDMEGSGNDTDHDDRRRLNPKAPDVPEPAMMDDALAVVKMQDSLAAEHHACKLAERQVVDDITKLLHSTDMVGQFTRNKIHNGHVHAELAANPLELQELMDEVAEETHQGTTHGTAAKKSKRSKSKAITIEKIRFSKDVHLFIQLLNQHVSMGVYRVGLVTCRLLKRKTLSHDVLLAMRMINGLRNHEIDRRNQYTGSEIAQQAVSTFYNNIDVASEGTPADQDGELDEVHRDDVPLSELSEKAVAAVAASLSFCGDDIRSRDQIAALLAPSTPEPILALDH